MADQKYYYLVEIQYLGFRYHGWQKQPDVKTVQGMIDKTLKNVLGHTNFNTLGSSRTDAGVSANSSYFELFTSILISPNLLLAELNAKLPNDIRALNIKEVDAGFNIIQHSKIKEYIYLFSYGEKNHPFGAPIMVYMEEQLDITKMKQGASLFTGYHNFRSYCTKPAAETDLKREILLSQIEENTFYNASFFPDSSYLYRIKSKGFMRHQVRLMMGALFDLGKGIITLEQIEESLKGEKQEPLSYMAPASGLILNKVLFE